jgi:hypothetical protein
MTVAGFILKSLTKNLVMNSKKTLAILGLIIFFIINGKAQPRLLYDNSSKWFNVTIPAIDYPQKKGLTPYTKAFLETGTGSFFIFTTSSYQQRIINKNFNFSPSANVRPPIVQMNTFYDTTGRPPHATSIASFNPQRTTAPNPIQNELPVGTFLKINTSVSSANACTVIPGDTMTVALTYKNSVHDGDDVSAYNNSILAFYYNGAENPHIFSDVPTSDNTLLYQFDGVSVPALRKHNGETIMTRNEIPDAVRYQFDTANSGYSRIIYISVPYDPNTAERNLFISMAPSKVLSDYTLANTSFKAVLIDFRGQGYGNVSEFLQPVGVDFASRDPNGIFTTPNCLDSQSISRPIKYRVHFENIGAGIANKISITVDVPKGIHVPDIGTNLFTCKIGNIAVPVYKEGTRPMFSSERQCFYRLDPSANTINFTINNARLFGTIHTKGENNYTYGDIVFKLKTESANVPECMQSKVSIVFDTNRPETDTDMIMLSCKPLTNCGKAFANPSISQ